MDDTITTIYECLQMSEEKYLKNKAKLRDIRDDLKKESNLQKLLKTDVENIESEISTLEKEINKMEANEMVKSLKIKSAEEKLETVMSECVKRKWDLDQEEKTVDRKIDNYIATVMNFHNHVGLHGKKKKPQPVNDDLYSNMSLIEEDALKCELNIREDLLKEKSELENELKGLQIKLKSLEEERTKEKQMVLFKLKEAIKVRNEISDPKKVSSIQKLEREISDMEQEIELLKNAYETLQKETGTEKPKFQFQFKRNLLRTDNEELPPSQVSTPQIFKRNLPPVTPKVSSKSYK